MKLTGETEVLGEKPVPVPLCPPQIPHGLTMVWFLFIYLWNSVSVEPLGYGLDGPGFKSRRGQDIFLFSKPSRPALGPTQPPINGYQSSFPAVRRSWRDVDHSSPPSADVKSYTSAPYPPYLHGVDRDTFTFTFTYDSFWRRRQHLRLSYVVCKKRNEKFQTSSKEAVVA
jgi:hypothetical protein